jgi:hypothetical protein
MLLVVVPVAKVIVEELDDVVAVAVAGGMG